MPGADPVPRWRSRGEPDQGAASIASPGQPEPGRKTSAWWDGFWRRPPPARGRGWTCRRTAEEALRLLRSERNSRRAGEASDRRSRLRVLDLGCGNGDLTPLFLADQAVDVVALDLSVGALDQFRRRGFGSRRLRLVRGDVYRLPFADGAFDGVVSFGYASAASYPGVEREVARVLRPGGIAVVDFANPSLYHWLADPRGTVRWYRRYRARGSGQYHFGLRGVAAHFRHVGLSLEAARYLNAYPPLEVVTRHAWCGAVDRWLASTFGRLLGRVLLVRLRREPT